MPKHVKLLFRLSPDSEGHPPVAVEGVWATIGPSGCVLDNIPFFAQAATLGDTVSVETKDGNIWFSGVLSRSENSLVRIVFFDLSRVDETRARLREYGCSTEWDQSHNLVAVNIPRTARLKIIQEFLRVEATRGILDYEEPILRQ